MILFKKAMRSIWRGKRSYISCIVLMGVGIMVYVAFNLLYINLDSAKNKLYTDQHFADAFANVRGMPVGAIDSILAINGIKNADARIKVDARVMLEGKEDKIITLRIHSFDPTEAEPLNKFLITQGLAAGENEIVVGDSFFKANKLKVGDKLKVIIDGKQVEFTISGAAQSPEYVYAIPDTGSVMPDNEAFGFAYVTYSQLATITGKQGLSNLLSFQLKDGVTFDDVKLQLEDTLAPYGLIGLFARKDQLSANMLDTEINSLGRMATSVPVVFIFMSIIILYIMLKRVIEQERVSIGTLKALGFSDREVLLHYLSYGVLTGALSGIFGLVGGYFMSLGFTDMYLEYFNLPALNAQTDPALMFKGMMISLVAGTIGAFMGTRGVLKLNPGEAMRPPAPPLVTSDVLKSLKFLRRILASNGFMAIRNITRSRFRSLFIMVGIAFSFALIGFTASYTDMMDKMMLEQFSKVLMYDVKVNLKDPKSVTDALEAVYGVGEVSLAEGTLEIPSELRLAHLKENVIITGLESDARLQKIYDSTKATYSKPLAGGLIINTTLAKKINAKRGDVLMVKTVYTGDDEIAMPVLDIVNEVIGVSAYMELDSLCSLLGVPKSANCVLIDSNNPTHIKDAVESADNVSAVSDIGETRKVYDDMMKTYSSMFVMMQLSGVAVAYAIIANTASISLSERKREYATLRVLGMHPREIAKILGFEYWLLTLVGIPPGIYLLITLKRLLSGMMDSSMFSIPTTTPTSSYITAAVGCFLAVAICNFISTRNISKFDMVEVLKERE